MQHDSCCARKNLSSVDFNEDGDKGVLLTDNGDIFASWLHQIGIARILVAHDVKHIVCATKNDMLRFIIYNFFDSQRWSIAGYEF